MKYFKSIAYILDKKHFNKIFYLVILMILAMLLETFGLSLVFPLLTMIVTDTEIAQIPFLSNIFSNLNMSKNEFLFYFIIFLPIYFFIKNIFLAYQLYSQSKFISDVHADTSQKIFKNYLNRDFNFFLNNNSSKLIQHSTVEINEFSAAILSLIQLLTEIFIFVGLVSLLLIFETKGALMIIVFLIFSGFVFYTLTKKKLLKWGEERQFYDGEKLKHLQQSFSLIREVKIYMKEIFFLEKYFHPNYNSAKISKWQSVLNALPRLWTELLAVLALTILLIYFHLTKIEYNQMIPILGIFVSVAFRLIPSLNRFLSSIQNLKFYLPVITLLDKELRSKNKVKINNSAIIFRKNVTLKNISFKYNDSRFIFKNLNLSINKGDMLGIIGASGSGKTTLINILLGLLDPTSGKILIDDQNLINPNANWYKKVGYVPQSVTLLDDTIKQNIALGVSKNNIDKNKIFEITKKVQLFEYIESLPNTFDTFVGERGSRLSGGQIQRIGIARALYRDIELLILDESTNSLDAETENQIIHSINNLKREVTIVMISHDMNVLKFCNKIYDLTADKMINKN